MARDPYEVLGISPNASDEEIKKAYTELAKKYHPDRYQNNPLADLAEEKFKEVNEAFETIKSQREGRASGGYGSYGSGYSNGYGGSTSGNTYGGYSNSYGSTSSDYVQIRMALNENQLGRAEQLLINHQERDAEWFYLSGILAYKRRLFGDAISYLNQAVEMDPNNAEYRNARDQLQGIGGMFAGRSNAGGYNPQSNACSDCLTCYCCLNAMTPCSPCC